MSYLKCTRLIQFKYLLNVNLYAYLLIKHESVNIFNNIQKDVKLRILLQCH